MLFMGEEWGSKTPFPFFCDLAPDLALLVARGRRKEFSEFFDPEEDGLIPDPGADETFRRAVLDWASLDEPEHTGRLKLYGELLALRREKIVPRLAGIPGDVAAYQIVDDRGLSVRWTLGDGSTLTLFAIGEPCRRSTTVSTPCLTRSRPTWLEITETRTSTRATMTALPAETRAFGLYRTGIP